MAEGRHGRRLNKFEAEYIAEIEKGLKERTDLDDRERHMLEMEVVHIRDGTITLSAPYTLEDRLTTLRNHYP